MAVRAIVPLDPDSARGRETADRLSQVLAEVRVAIAERERAAAAQDDATERAA
jgi:hypothetical protein